jgi:hypothetical protein
MKNNEIIENLNCIKSFINKKEYKKAIDHIEKIKASLLEESDPVNEYMNNLVSDLK